jgi:GT2 family glycosyltransferase
MVMDRVRETSAEGPKKFPRLHLQRSPTPMVTVIIPAASTPELLGACLMSLSQFGPRGIPFETIVVLDEAVAAVESQLRDAVKGVEVVTSTVNLGLSGALNRGRSLARGKFLVTLHDDAEIEPGWLEALVECAEAHPEAGAIGGKVLFPDGRLQHAGMILWRDGLTSPPWAGQRPPPTAFDRMRPVDYCGTSSLLVRAAALDAIGGLDERFYPGYYVDVNLSMALRQLGFIVLYQPKSRIRHHLSSSTTPRFRNFISSRNHLLFLEKWATALESHEPPGRDEPAAVQRALARAEAFARAARLRGAPALDQLTKPNSFDPVLQERQHLEKSRALQKAYVIHLTESIDAAEIKLVELERELAQHRARSRTFARIERGWRWTYRSFQRLKGGRGWALPPGS